MLEYLTVVVLLQITMLVVYKLTLTLIKHAAEKKPPKGKNSGQYRQAM